MEYGSAVRNLSWGMSRDEVILREGDAADEHAQGLGYRVSLAGFDGTLICYFDQDCLRGVMYSFDDYDDTLDVLAYARILSLLEEKYGRPRVEVVAPGLTADRVPDDAREIATLVASGLLEITNTWFSATSMITLRLRQAQDHYNAVAHLVYADADFLHSLAGERADFDLI